MDLVFIHGPAAAGKLTVARELAALTGISLFHNHLVVDAVSAVFPFGSSSFVRVRHEMWMAMFREAAREDRSLIFTFAPERSVPAEFVSEVVEEVSGAGGNVLFVQLICPLHELERRIENPSRAEFGKLRSLETFRRIRREGSSEFPPLPDSGLTIDTSQMDPKTAAEKIKQFFGL